MIMYKTAKLTIAAILVTCSAAAAEPVAPTAATAEAPTVAEPAHVPTKAALEKAHKNAVELIATCEKEMKLVSSEPLQPRRTLNMPSEGVAVVRKASGQLLAAVDKLPPADEATVKAFAARVEVWATKEEARLAAETAGRAGPVAGMCYEDILLQNARYDLAQERANPSGVVNLYELNRIGRQMQEAQYTMRTLAPSYVAFRHHPFTTRQSEGSCVEEDAQSAADPNNQ